MGAASRLVMAKNSNRGRLAPLAWAPCISRLATIVPLGDMRKWTQVNAAAKRFANLRLRFVHSRSRQYVAVSTAC